MPKNLKGLGTRNMYRDLRARDGEVSTASKNALLVPLTTIIELTIW